MKSSSKCMSWDKTSRANSNKTTKLLSVLRNSKNSEYSQKINRNHPCFLQFSILSLSPLETVNCNFDLFLLDESTLLFFQNFSISSQKTSQIQNSKVLPLLFKSLKLLLSLIPQNFQIQRQYQTLQNFQIQRKYQTLSLFPPLYLPVPLLYHRLCPHPRPQSRPHSSSSLSAIDNFGKPSQRKEGKGRSRPQWTHQGTVSRKAVSRCLKCGKRVGLTGFRRRCKGLFCGDHRDSDCHDCKFDYKAVVRERIQKENPLVRAAKVVQIWTFRREVVARKEKDKITNR